MDSQIEYRDQSSLIATSDRARKRRFGARDGLTTLEILLWTFVVAVVIFAIFVFVNHDVRDKVFAEVNKILH